MGVTDYTGVVGGPGHADQPNVARAIVAIPPQTAVDSMEVMLVGYTSQYTYEVPSGNWSPRGKTLPALGASCVVCFDHPTGDAWVPMWEGVDTQVDSADVGVNVGDVKMTVAAVAPPGWLMCNGQAVPRAGNFATLFALIGTTYGPGDGHSTFNLPNWQGKMPIGASATYPLGSTGGEATHTLSEAEMPVHNHGSKTGTGITGTATTGTGTTGTGMTGTGTTGTGTTGGGTTGGSSTGGGTTGYVSNDHTHTYSGTTATENQGFNFNYSGTTSDVSQWNGNQGYNVWSCTGGATLIAITWGATYVGGDNRKYQDFAHQHTYSGTTGTQNQNHNHNFSGTTSGISSNHTHTVPSLSIPGLSIPGLSVPGLSVPSLSVPGLSVPGLSVPGLNVPALSIANDGSGTPHNNLPPYEAINFVIKY